MAGNYGSRRPGITSLLARFDGNLQDETTIGWFGKILAAVLIDEAIGKWGEKHEHP